MENRYYNLVIVVFEEGKSLLVMKNDLSQNIYNSLEK